MRESTRSNVDCGAAVSQQCHEDRMMGALRFNPPSEEIRDTGIHKPNLIKLSQIVTHRESVRAADEKFRRRAFRGDRVRRQLLPKPNRFHSYDKRRSGTTNGPGRRTLPPVPGCLIARVHSSVRRCHYARRSSGPVWSLPWAYADVRVAAPTTPGVMDSLPLKIST